MTRRKMGAIESLSDLFICYVRSGIKHTLFPVNTASLRVQERKPTAYEQLSWA